MIILSENPYLQELRRQGESLNKEIIMLYDDYGSINDLFVLAKLKSIIEKKEKRFLEITKEVIKWQSEMPL